MCVHGTSLLSKPLWFRVFVYAKDGVEAVLGKDDLRCGYLAEERGKSYFVRAWDSLNWKGRRIYAHRK
jgi:hypothetical protein